MRSVPLVLSATKAGTVVHTAHSVGASVSQGPEVRLSTGDH